MYWFNYKTVTPLQFTLDIQVLANSSTLNLFILHRIVFIPAEIMSAK